jgi:hypothetical protein
MRLEDAQREMREVYLGGSPGQIVSGLVWLASAALATWGSRSSAIASLIVGGMFIFPITMLALRLLGRRATVSRENPLSALAIQVAFTVPLAIPIILVATINRPEWFYPGFMIIVGAHYLPFVTLYGLRQFMVPAVVLVGAGWTLPVLAPGSFSLGGWIGGAVLVALGLWLLGTHAAGRTGAARA